MSDLVKKKCKPCEGGTEPLERETISPYLLQIPGWQVDASHTSIHKRFHFRNFHETMAFINAMAWLSHQEDHHADFTTGYNYCDVQYTTHAISGLSENDFICAAKIERLLING